MMEVIFEMMTPLGADSSSDKPLAVEATKEAKKNLNKKTVVLLFYTKVGIVSLF